MKIGVDLSFIRPDHTNGGTESCIINLIKGFINIGKIGDFIFFIHEDIYDEYKDKFPTVQFHVYKMGGNHKIRTLLFQTFCLKYLIRKLQIKTIYFPTYTTGLRNNYGVPIVVNPHDLQFKIYPEYFSDFKRFYLNMLYKNSLKKADKIIGISNYVKGTLEKYYKRECTDKIELLYDPVDFDDSDMIPYNAICGSYILSVNSIQKHKNIITLVKAYNLIKDKMDEKLVLVGSEGNGNDEISHFITENNLQDDVLFTGRISDGEIKWLYNNARLFVTTSLYEGFGMTPIEAMGRGCVTISTRCTSLEEVTQGCAIYLDNPLDCIELAEKLLNGLIAEKPNNYIDKIINSYDKNYISNKYNNRIKNTITLKKN